MRKGACVYVLRVVESGLGQSTQETTVARVRCPLPAARCLLVAGGWVFGDGGPGCLPRLGLARRATWREGGLSKRARPFAALPRSSTHLAHINPPPFFALDTHATSQ